MTIIFGCGKFFTGIRGTGNPPVIGGGDNNGDFLNMLPNAPIGLWPGLEYEGEEIDNIKDRTLFIYTDGLNEAENQQQEQFGDDRLFTS